MLAEAKGSRVAKHQSWRPYLLGRDQGKHFRADAGKQRRISLPLEFPTLIERSKPSRARSMWAITLAGCPDTDNELLEHARKFLRPERGLATAFLPVTHARYPPATALDRIEIKQAHFQPDQQPRQFVPVSPRHMKLAEHDVELFPAKQGTSLPDGSRQGTEAAQLFQVGDDMRCFGNGFSHQEDFCTS